MDIMEVLNDNQGVLSALSLIVSLLGFSGIGIAIRTTNKQSQRGGRDSINQQAQNGGLNQNAKGNIKNN